MPWTKLKNIILFILVVANLALLALVAGPAIRSRRGERQAREDAIRLRQSRGVQVEDSDIPERVTLLPRTVERDLTVEERAAAALLDGPVIAEARGGEVYRYFNENGYIQFHSDGALSARLEPGRFFLGEDVAAGCTAIMEKLGVSGTVVGETETEVLFRQTWEGRPLFTQQVTLVCEDGCLTAIANGRQLVGRPQEDAGRKTVSVATALIDFLNGVNALGDVCSRIDAIEPGYVAAVSLSGPTTLTPVWRVITDTGAYQVDAVTGGVTRVS